MQDPLAEYHFNQSPYNYVLNNPIIYIDPFGLDSTKNISPGGDPIFPIPEVTVTGEKPADQQGGVRIDGNGDWNPRETAKYTDSKSIDMSSIEMEYGTKILAWIRDLFRKNNSNEGNDNSEVSIEETSDKDIYEQNTGTGKKTDAAARPLDEIDQMQGQQDESDSLVVTYTLKYRDGKPLIQRDKKQHKHENKGRWITKPYKVE